MNKAFTREPDGDEEDDEGTAAAPALPAGTRNYLTPGGYQRLRAELLALLDVERPKIVEVVSWAAKNGDRSENGDYLYGKKRLREIDRRIQEKAADERLLNCRVTIPPLEEFREKPFSDFSSDGLAYFPSGPSSLMLKPESKRCPCFRSGMEILWPAEPICLLGTSRIAKRRL